ncbi:MAG: hypothetical protein GWM92_14170, partial [Gemmatimonadetes bacterium]|nr:hypothetical protein [Gemmatimonadota bacterium]NIR79878.1 hypothetical protein [Gemmatimonadota bacterium]NIT88595.1 hypothetical protein [Gemmatimonadota bacterium]NIU32418.1 hypothetical protein [Gemmatimonadota bacterium]NIU36915.1 hypothetical protein [Gemmatimonadota bacterium]
TEMARERLAPVLAEVAGAGEDLRTRAAESSWWVRAQPLVEGDPEQGHRVVAVPLEPV